MVYSLLTLGYSVTKLLSVSNLMSEYGKYKLRAIHYIRLRLQISTELPNYLKLRADLHDQYRITLMVGSFQFELRAPLLITLLKPSNPKHQYPRGGPYLQMSIARCVRK